MMATEKQIRFIERLMREREIGDLYDDVVAQTIRRGQEDNLSVRQASEFIDLLLECPKTSGMSEQMPPKYEPNTSLTTGCRVRWQARGQVLTGTVRQLLPAGRVIVNFDNGDEKTIIGSFLTLE